LEARRRGAALDLAHALLALRAVRPGIAPEAAEQPPEEDRLPLGLREPGVGEEAADPLGAEVGVGGAEVEVEGDLRARRGRRAGAAVVDLELVSQGDPPIGRDESTEVRGLRSNRRSARLDRR